jgi:MFS family permease
MRDDAVLRRNLGLDFTASIGVGVSFIMVAGLLSTVGRRAGMDALGLAMLGAAPFLANALGMLAGRFGPRSPRQLAVLRASGAALLVLLILAPFPPLMILVAAGYWLSMSFGTPFQARMWGAIYPPRLRGRFLGLLGTGRAAAGGVAVLVAGLLAASIGDVPAIAAVGVLGMLLVLASAGIRAPAAADPPKFSARASIRVLRGKPAILNALFAQGFYGGGLIAAAPLYALVLVDRLHLSLAQVGFIGMLAAASTTVSYLAWGSLADRRGGQLLLGLASVLGLTSLLLWAVTPSVVLLYVAAISGGLAGAGIDLGLQSVMISGVPSEERGAVMAGWNALTGIRGVAAPFVATGLVQFGVLSVTGALLACAVVTAVGMAIYLRRVIPTMADGGLPALWRRVGLLRV